MKMLSMAGLAAAALIAVPATAQQDVPGRSAHSPQLGTPGAAATGNSAAQIKARSGGGTAHAPRTAPRTKAATRHLTRRAAR